MSEIKMTKSSSEGTGVPKGAEILKKDTTVRVEKIENGFIISKNTEIRYKIKDRTDYAYVDKKYFSETDPMEIKLNGKSLSDDFK